MIIERAIPCDAADLLALQKLAYQSEAVTIVFFEKRLPQFPNFPSDADHGRLRSAP